MLAIAALGIGLIAWGAKGALGAGIASVIAAFSLTWKGIGEFFGRAAAKGEAELWDAEIDWAIAHRFTTLRNYPDEKQIKQSGALLVRSRATSRCGSICNATSTGGINGQTPWLPNLSESS